MECSHMHALAQTCKCTFLCAQIARAYTCKQYILAKGIGAISRKCSVNCAFWPRAYVQLAGNAAHCPFLLIIRRITPEGVDKGLKKGYF